MPYRVIDIYKDLPQRKGCSDCGKPGCFALATAVYLEGHHLGACPHLSEEQRVAMEAKAQAGRHEGAGPREEPEEQAAKLLQETLAQSDFAELAPRAEVTLHPGPPPSLVVPYLGQSLTVTADSVHDGEAGDVTVWLKVLLMMYVTRASGRPLAREWVAFRELPNTISKQATFEQFVERLGPVYGEYPAALQARAEALNATVLDHASADLALCFQALPRVPLLLLLWRGDDDFPARASLLLDRMVLDYLDQEALTFLAEDLVRRMSV
jgi:hypothetical protein